MIFEKKLIGLGFAASLALFWFYDGEGIFVWLVLAAAIHELGHMAAAWLCGGRILSLEPSGFGLMLRYGGICGYGKDLIIAAAGPLANLTAAFFVSYAAKYGIFFEKAYVFAGFNLITALFNLIPAQPMDGGGMLFAALAARLELDRALRLSRAVSAVCGWILIILGLYIAVKTRYNISILAAGALIIGGLYAKGAG